jgi:hypothetical protein
MIAIGGYDKKLITSSNPTWKLESFSLFLETKNAATTAGAIEVIADDITAHAEINRNPGEANIGIIETSATVTLFVENFEK